MPIETKVNKPIVTSKEGNPQIIAPRTESILIHAKAVIAGEKKTPIDNIKDAIRERESEKPAIAEKLGKRDTLKMSKERMYESRDKQV